MATKLPVEMTSLLPNARTSLARPRLQDLEADVPAPSIQMVPVAETTAFRSTRGLARFGLLLACVFVGSLFLFGAKAVIAGAVVANGVLVVETGAKAVQHATGGVVSDLPVREGDVVKAGDVVLRLDSQVKQAELMAVETTLANRLARLARLIAERDGTQEIGQVPMPEFDLLSPSERGAIFLNESIQLGLRAEAREGKKEQLRSRIERARGQIGANAARMEAIERELKLVGKELGDLRGLEERNLVKRDRLVAKERDFTQLETRKIELNAENLDLEGRIADLQLQIAEVDQQLRASITDQISDTRSAVAELVQRRIALSRALDTLELRAPQDGTVLRMAVRSPGEVAAPGQVLMTIVPADDTLIGEIRVRPNEIDQLYPEQPAVVIFSAFDRGTTPQLHGRIASISPDLVQDPATGERFYHVRLHVEEAQVERLGGVKLVPGMPVETFIRTGERTLLSYVTKPITDQLRRSLR